MISELDIVDVVEKATLNFINELMEGIIEIIELRQKDEPVQTNGDLSADETAQMALDALNEQESTPMFAGWLNVKPATTEVLAAKTSSFNSWLNVTPPSPPSLAVPSIVPANQPQTIPQSAPVAEEKDDGVMRAIVSRDSRDRACIPVSFIRELNLSYGDDLWICHRAGGDGLVAMVKEPKGEALTNYYVDSDGNVRITSWCLAQGGILTNNVKFRMMDNKKGIVILPA